MIPGNRLLASLVILENVFTDLKRKEIMFNLI